MRRKTTSSNVPNPIISKCVSVFTNQFDTILSSRFSVGRLKNMLSFASGLNFFKKFRRYFFSILHRICNEQESSLRVTSRCREISPIAIYCECFLCSFSHSSKLNKIEKFENQECSQVRYLKGKV